MAGPRPDAPKLSRRHRELLEWLQPDDEVWTDADDAAYSRGTVKLFVVLMAITVVGASVFGWEWWDHHHAAPAPVVGTSAPSVVAPLSALPSAPPPRLRPLEFDSNGLPTIPPGATPEELQAVIAYIAQKRVGVMADEAPQFVAGQSIAVCTYLKSAHRRSSELEAWVSETHPAWSSDQAAGFVGASLGVYCPQYGYLIDDANLGDQATS